MGLAIYAGGTGMDAEQINLDIIGNNLANVNTVGYKRSKAEFQDLLYQNVQAIGADSGTGNEVPTGVQVGNGVKLVSTSKIFTQGELTLTNEDKDIAIDGVGFFEVTMPDGTKSYTRDGAFKVNSNGEFTNNSGYLISGFQSLPADVQKIFVSDNGQITVQSASGSQTYRLPIYRFANPGGLKSIGGNLLVETDASGTAEQGNPGELGFGTLKQGYLEMSNVKPVTEMVNLIVAQRAYEMDSKVVQAADENMSKINQLKR